MNPSSARQDILLMEKEINDHLRQASNPDRSGRLSEVFKVIVKFDRLASLLYLMRASRYDDQAEDIVGALSQDLVRLQHAGKRDENIYVTFVNRYRGLWRKHFALFLFSAFIFTGTGILGYQLASKSPEYVSVILSRDMIETILQKKEWFSKLDASPILGGAQIAINNIGVAIKCFIGGAVLGIGGAILLIYNGVMIGAVLGFCAANNFREPLTRFVTAHGPLELSIIVASAFAGFIFGAAFYKRPVRFFRYRLSEAGREAAIVLMGILPWLVVAATMESFVSPWAFIPFKVKFALGLIAAAVFWTWTLIPPSVKNDSIRAS